MTILIFLAVLILLVFVHEMGHFITAKLSGVKVEEFGFGYPPRLVGVNWKGTIYSINALPLGGFVKLLGEEDPKEPGSLAGKSLGTRFIVLGAGSFMNALLPFLLFSASLAIPHQVTVGQVQVEQVAAGSPAERAGLQPGDILRSINGNPIRNPADLRYQVQLNLGNAVTLGVERAGTLQQVSLSPRWNPPPGQGAIGIVMALTATSTVTESYPFWQAIPKGVRTTLDTFTLVKNEIKSWFIRRAVPQVAGPIGIAQMTGEVAKAGFSPLLEFTAFLSLNLAILNLFPIPGLDGGRLVFVFLEAVRRGKRISPKKESSVHLIGFALLIGMIILVSYYDLVRLIQGGSFGP